MNDKADQTNAHGMFPKDHPPIVSRDEWSKAHRAMLAKEKAQMKARDALVAERRRMPWMAVESNYKFEGPNGPASLLDLFEGRRQLIVYRAFFESEVHGWPDHACVGCSMVADQVSHLAHVNARDVTVAYVSRAPQADIERQKARMGWEQIPGTRSRTISMPISVSINGTATTRSSRTAPTSTAPISSTVAATRPSARSGAISTWRRSVARKCGKTRRRDIRRRLPTNGRTGTTATHLTAKSIPSGIRCPPPASRLLNAVSTTDHEIGTDRRSALER